MKHIKEYSELFENEVGPKIRKSNHYESEIIGLFSPLKRTGKLEKIEMWKSTEKINALDSYYPGLDSYYPVVFIEGLKPIRFYYLVYYHKESFEVGGAFYQEAIFRMDYGDMMRFRKHQYDMIPQFYKDLEKETGLVVKDGIQSYPGVVPDHFSQVFLPIKKIAEEIEKRGGDQLEKGVDWKKTQIGEMIQIMGFQEVPTKKSAAREGNIYLDHPLSPYRYSVTMSGYIRRKRKADGENLQGYVIRTNPIQTVKQYEELLRGCLKGLRLDVRKEDLPLLEGFVALAEKGLSYAVENNIPLPYSQIVEESEKIRSQWEAGGFDQEKARKLEKRWNILQRDI